MASKCVIEVQQVVSEYAATLPAVGKLIADASSQITRLQGLKVAQTEAERLTEGASIGLNEAAQRFIREGELPESFTRPGDVPIRAAKGKINKREAQQAGIMNQWGMAPAYARIAGLARGWGKREGEQTGEQINVFVTQLNLHDAILRQVGIPLSTTKAGAEAGKFFYSNVTFGDIIQVFAQKVRPSSISKYFLRSKEAAENIQSQNTAEAVRRILEHGDLYGKINLPDDLPILKAQVLDALRNPSGLGKPPKGKALDEYNAAIKWANEGDGLKLTDELADELLEEDIIVSMIKENERLGLVTKVLSNGDGLKMTEAVLKMIVELPHLNDARYAYGDLLFNNRLREIYKDDVLVNMTPDQLNLVFGEHHLARFFNDINPDDIVKIKDSYRSSNGKQADRVKNEKAAAAGKSTLKEENTNSNRAWADKQAEQSPAAATKAAKDMEDSNVVPQEASLEGSQKARQYQLEFEVGPLLGGAVRAFGWVSDKVTMGGKLKTSIIGAEHFRLENAATMTAQLSKLFKAAGQDTNLVNDTFRALQSGTPIDTMPEAQRELAQNMSKFIEDIFGFGPRNNLEMNGIWEDEFIKSLKYLGLNKAADDIQAVSGFANNPIGEWWKSVDLDGQNALTMMAKVYSAMQLSRIKPTIASTLREHFSHTAEGLTYSQAVKLGYQSLADTSPLAKFINVGEKPTLFHPEIIRNMRAVNAHLEFEKGFKSEAYQKFWNKMDPTIGVLKSSLTIWRPGHHMVSMVGNILFNATYGVTPNDYAAAVRMLVKRGDVLDVDEAALTAALREGAPEGYALKGDGSTWSLVINGKVVEVPIELLLRGADEIGGVPISVRAAKDLPNDTDPANFAVDGFVQRTPGVKQVAQADRGLAKVAAVRDNVARYALYMRELRRGGYSSIEDAILSASRKVHEVHPTVGTLTNVERKYARRAFYFYTWQKQALFKVMEMVANQPALVTMPSKLQYALATAAGLNPESYGDAWDPDGLYASYFTNSVFAPQQNDPVLGAVGIRPASPQLDVIDAFFSKVSTRPGLGFWESLGDLMANTSGGILVGNASPLFKIPAELATGTKTSGQRIDNIGEYLLDQSGLGGITRMTGYTPWGEQRSDFKEGDYGVRDRARQQLNYWTGIKSTYYQSPASLEIARQERIDYWNRYYKTGKYSEDK
jgi:hypothetical protein